LEPIFKPIGFKVGSQGRLAEPTGRRLVGFFKKVDFSEIFPN
jgi:hypothetical protein